MPSCFFQTDLTTNDICAALSDDLGVRVELAGCQQLPMLRGVADSRRGGTGCLSFAPGRKRKPITSLSGSFVIVDEFLSEDSTANLYCKVDDARAVFIDLLQICRERSGVVPHARDYQATAAVHEAARIAPSAVLESGVCIAEGAEIGAGAVIRSGTRIAENTRIGENVCIGGDGITVYRARDGRLLRFPHVAGTTIGARTEIGSGTIIPSGILTPTEIGDDAVIGNLCNIGHGARIESSVWMSVGTLIGGHVLVEQGATIGMGVTIRDNRAVGENASVGMGSVVVQNVTAGRSVFGNPAKTMGPLKAGPTR